MQRVLIHDPHRVPKHWMELLHPGQFAVFLQDVRTSVLLDAEGRPFAESGSAGCCYLFDSLEEARRFCLELVERSEHVRYDIYDERGMAVEPLYTFAKERHKHLVGSKATARGLMLGGALAILLSLPLFWYDWLAEGARIWPAVIGINLIFAGIRLLIWGRGEFERLQRQEQEQSLAESRSASSRKAGH
jgi:hypothetical protein